MRRKWISYGNAWWELLNCMWEFERRMRGHDVSNVGCCVLFDFDTLKSCVIDFKGCAADELVLVNSSYVNIIASLSGLGLDLTAKNACELVDKLIKEETT